MTTSMAKPIQQIVPAKKACSRWSKVSSTWPQLCLSLLALGLFAVVVVYVQGTYSAVRFSAEKRALSSFLKSDVSTTLAIVRASQGLLSALMTGLLKSMFVLLQWTLMNSTDGLSYHNLLALSPTTESLGGLAILRSPRSLLKLDSKIWLLMRVSLTFIVWLSGLVLFFNTSIVTVYDTARTRNATAGVGPFNASLIEPFTNYLRLLAPSYPYQVLPFTYLAAVYILVLNPLISTVSEPVRCEGDKCVSYLLSGGLEMVAPWNLPGHEEHTMIKVDNTPSIQMDFSAPASDMFLLTDCDDFGKSGFNIGIRLCVAQESDDASLRAGLFVCVNGTDNGACGTSSPKPNITTHVSFYTRKATVIAARSNYSIVSIEQTSAPVLLHDIDLPGYREALRWLLNFTAADIPPPSSIAQSFWSSPQQLQGGTSTFGILEQNFHSIIAFPFWLFNSNNWANTDLRSNETISGLPPQFYTTASIVEPFAKIKFDQGMFILFVALQGLAMMFVWAVLLWVWFVVGPVDQQPEISSFPLYDIVFRARTVVDDASEEVLMRADDRGIIELAKDSRVYYATT